MIRTVLDIAIKLGGTLFQVYIGILQIIGNKWPRRTDGENNEPDSLSGKKDERAARKILLVR